MESVYENVRKELRAETVRETLEWMDRALKEESNALKISKAREDSGHDLIEVMRVVFPMVVDVQVEAVAKLGLPRNKEGLRDFLQRAQTLAPSNPDIAALILDIRSIYMPPFQRSE